MKTVLPVSWLGGESQGYFASALFLARQQKAKSWELRASKAAPLRPMPAQRAAKRCHASTMVPKDRTAPRPAMPGAT
jgi:hypothetical protein